MLEIEKDFFDQHTEMLMAYRKDILLNLMNFRGPSKIYNQEQGTETQKGTETYEKTEMTRMQQESETTSIQQESEIQQQQPQQQNPQQQRPQQQTSTTQETETTQHIQQTRDSTHSISGTDHKSKKVKILRKIEEIVGPDLEIYGPYEEGHEVDLPTDLAQALIIKEQATEIKQYHKSEPKRL